MFYNSENDSLELGVLQGAVCLQKYNPTGNSYYGTWKNEEEIVAEIKRKGLQDAPETIEALTEAYVYHRDKNLALEVSAEKLVDGIIEEIANILPELKQIVPDSGTTEFKDIHERLLEIADGTLESLSLKILEKELF